MGMAGGFVSFSNVWWSRIAGAASVGFRAFIAITSIAGAVVGVLAWNGWLAIAYGSLGLTMGVAGIAAVWTRPPLRSALFGWFLVGIAGRAILEGGIYLWLISIPVAVALLAALAFELVRRPSATATKWALAGVGRRRPCGLLAVCARLRGAKPVPDLHTVSGPGKVSSSRLVPTCNPPWDVAERKYQDYCFRTTR